MDNTFNEWANAGFVWLPERGMGHYPVKGGGYDAAYFAKYVEYEQTELGKALTLSRYDLVRTYTNPALVVDVGIGSGQFVQAAGCTGYDINPAALSWLTARGLLRDIYDRTRPAHAATFWDSLEHIPNPALILDNIEQYVFAALPIFESGEHVVRSKHFRKDEHIWYWTHRGLIDWMRVQGFGLVYHDKRETDLGREDIASYVFSRDAWA